MRCPCAPGVGAGWVPINVVLGGITPGAGFEGPFTDVGFTGFNVGIDSIVSDTAQAGLVGVFFGGGFSFSGMAGYQWDITDEVEDFIDFATFW